MIEKKWLCNTTQNGDPKSECSGISHPSPTVTYWSWLSRPPPHPIQLKETPALAMELAISSEHTGFFWNHSDWSMRSYPQTNTTLLAHRQTTWRSNASLVRVVPRCRVPPFGRCSFIPSKGLVLVRSWAVKFLLVVIRSYPLLQKGLCRLGIPIQKWLEMMRTERFIIISPQKHRKWEICHRKSPRQQRQPEAAGRWKCSKAARGCQKWSKVAKSGKKEPKLAK